MAIGAVVGAVVAAAMLTALPSAHPVAAPVSAPVVVDTGDQAALVKAEDDRLSHLVGDVLHHREPYLVPAAGRSLPTEVLTARAAPYDLPSLEALGAVRRMPDGARLLIRSVLVGRGARLAVAAPGATLRITSSSGGFASIVAFEGGLALSGAPGAPLSVTSWDPSTSHPDTALGDGRAYVRAFGARMDLAQVRMSDLGFWSGRTGGLAWTGSATAAATGTASGTSVERDHYGLFCSRATGLALDTVGLYRNDVDGLLVRRDSRGLVARTVTTSANGGSGIAVEDGAQGVTLDRVTASGNAVAGIRLDGGPTAKGTGPNGTGYAVTGSTISDNRAAGVLAIRTDGLVVRGDTLHGNGDGITLDGPARSPAITDDVIDTPGVAVAVRGGTVDATITGNRIGAARIGVLVRDATAHVDRNTVTAASRYGVLMVGDVGTTTVADDVLGGGGPAAVALRHPAVGALPTVTGVDDSGWRPDYVAIATRYVTEHPLVLLWALILLVPLAFRLRMRRRRREPVVAIPHPRPQPAGGGPEATTKLPVTKVTVVSGPGAAVGQPPSPPGSPDNADRARITTITR